MKKVKGFVAAVAAVVISLMSGCSYSIRKK